jgi:putative ABC transport system ATP-binding protein
LPWTAPTIRPVEPGSGASLPAKRVRHLGMVLRVQKTRQPASVSARNTPTTPGGLLRRGFQRHRGHVALSVVLLSLWQLSEAMVPVIVGVIIDHALSVTDFSALMWWSGVLLGAFLSLSYSYRFGAAVAFRVRQEETHALRVEIAGHVLHPQGARTGMLTGETLSLATSDADAAGGVARSISYTVASLIAVIVGSLALLRINAVIGLAVLMGVPAVLVAIQVLTPLVSRQVQEQQARVATASGTATDLVRGLRVLKGLGAEDVASARYRTASQRAKDAGIRSAWSFGGMEALTAGLSGAFLGVIALLAGRRALDASISVGEFVSIVGLTQFLSVPIGALGQFGAQLAGARGSARRIVDFLGTPRLVDAGARVPQGRLSTVSVMVSRAEGSEGFSVESTAGEFLCLVLDHPHGGARLAQLLAAERLPDAADSCALVNGARMTDVALSWRRSNMVVNPHHADLFEGSLRSNIDPLDVHDEETLGTFLRASAFDDVVGLQPRGIGQRVAARGSTLSGGQRQRLALARALAADPLFLFLSEPTSSVDSVTEQRIAAGIRRLRHESRSTQFTWIATTSPALLAAADRVVVVRGGEVIAQGRHSQLLSDPFYQELVLR